MKNLTLARVFLSCRLCFGSVVFRGSAGANSHTDQGLKIVQTGTPHAFAKIEQCYIKIFA